MRIVQKATCQRDHVRLALGDDGLGLFRILDHADDTAILLSKLSLPTKP